MNRHPLPLSHSPVRFAERGRFAHQARPRERGIALFTAMVLLTVLSLLAVSSVQRSRTETRIVTNSVAKSLTFEAAEAAIQTVVDEYQTILPVLVDSTQPTNIDYSALSGMEVEWIEAEIDYVDAVSAGPGYSLNLGTGSSFRRFDFEVSGSARLGNARSVHHQGVGLLAPGS